MKGGRSVRRELARVGFAIEVGAIGLAIAAMVGSMAVAVVGVIRGTM